MAADLVTRARNGDKQAWDALVERYAPLIWSICRRHGLGDTDTEDVGQNVWLKLVNQLETIRVPAALPSWLAAPPRECGRILRAAPRARETGHIDDTQAIADDRAPTAEEELLAAERQATLREALTHLPSRCQQLITLLAQDPPPSYAQISTMLGIPEGSIGPKPRPLPGQAAPPPGHRRTDQPRSRDRGVRCTARQRAMRTRSR